MFERSFSKKDLCEATYILSIKIYRDRSRRLISFFFNVKLSKTHSPTTAEDRKRMKIIPYASALGSIKYAMMCTRSIVYPTLSLAREYNSDLGVDHWTAVKILIRICFSIMEVTKGSS